jgi:hypothetical protein
MTLPNPVIERLAELLHEGWRESQYQRTARKPLAPWADLSAEAREDRRVQACYLISKREEIEGLLLVNSALLEGALKNAVALVVKES